jgi:hypothetical protein
LRPWSGSGSVITDAGYFTNFTTLDDASAGWSGGTDTLVNDGLQCSKSDFAALHPVQSGADTVIALDAADAVTLTGVTASTLTAAQFRFV